MVGRTHSPCGSRHRKGQRHLSGPLGTHSYLHFMLNCLPRPKLILTFEEKKMREQSRRFYWKNLYLFGQWATVEMVAGFCLLVANRSGVTRPQCQIVFILSRYSSPPLAAFYFINGNLFASAGGLDGYGARGVGCVQDATRMPPRRYYGSHLFAREHPSAGASECWSAPQGVCAILFFPHCWRSLPVCHAHALVPPPLGNATEKRPATTTCRSWLIERFSQLQLFSGFAFTQPTPF